MLEALAGHFPKVPFTFRPAPGIGARPLARLTALLTNGWRGSGWVLTSRASQRAKEAERDEAIAQARAEAAAWRQRAALLEGRLAEIDARLAESERIALDLRARLVCSTGKLASAAATVRYRFRAEALEAGEAGRDAAAAPGG